MCKHENQRQNNNTCSFRKYSLILMDPPWENKHVKRVKGSGTDYKMMDNHFIQQIPGTTYKRFIQRLRCLILLTLCHKMLGIIVPTLLLCQMNSSYEEIKSRRNVLACKQAQLIIMHS